jgi:hypothetical protein
MYCYGAYEKETFVSIFSRAAKIMHKLKFLGITTFNVYFSFFFFLFFFFIDLSYWKAV